MTIAERPKYCGAAGPALTIRLLGPFEASGRDGTALQVPKKAQALLCYLIVNRDRIILRDEAATLLWSNTSSVQARQSLRQCLSALKKVFPPEASLHLKSDRQAIKLSCHHFDIDLVMFQCAAGSNDPEELALADAAYREDLLLGLNLDDEPFDDWLTLERQRLRLARIGAIDRLARLRAQNDDLPAAIDLAGRLLTLDRYREESLRLLMELLASSDQRGLAVVEYARTERLLRDDLGILPDPTTRALAERIRRGVVAGPLKSSAGTSQQGAFEQASRIRSSSSRRSAAVAASPKSDRAPVQQPDRLPPIR